jgi:hypothetical protein
MNQEEIQKNIEKNVANKEKRFNKTELSIQHRWAVNNAVSVLELWSDDLGNIEKYKEKIKEWRDWFIETDKEWMDSMMPQEEIKYEEIKSDFEIEK